MLFSPQYTKLLVSQQAFFLIFKTDSAGIGLLFIKLKTDRSLRIFFLIVNTDEIFRLILNTEQDQTLTGTMFDHLL